MCKKIFSLRIHYFFPSFLAKNPQSNENICSFEGKKREKSNE